MAIQSLSNNTLSSYALFGLSDATSRIEKSTFRLSTGNRLTSAGDDVAALSVSTKLRAQVSAMRQAVMNASQADSFLQVAYGGLSQISDILDDMKSIATQANSGSLTAADRALLDVQFQELSNEVDSIAGSTNFNGIKLIDGSVAGVSSISHNSNVATKATATLTFTANIGAGQTVNLNGVTFTEGVNFSAGGSIAASVNNLAVALNASTNTAISQATYTPLGSALLITHDTGGAQGNQYRINQNTSTSTFVTAGGSTPTANLFTLQGGTNDGIYMGGTTASGTIGDTLVNTQSQTYSSVTLSTTSSTFTAGNQIRIDNGVGGFVNFSFSVAPVANTDILIGSTTEATLENVISTISRYTGADDYGVRQLDMRSNGTDIIFTSKLPGNPVDLTGGALDIAETMANATLSAATFASGTNTGVNVSGVTNASFTGTIQGFTATYNSADNITASITVGSDTYTANITDTTPAANTFTRFSSTNGGYFDVQLASAGGMAVANQTNANTYASRLNAAFNTLTFYQTRPTNSFTAAGQLANASFEFKLDDFTNKRIDDISVSHAPIAGSDAVIDFDINGETFRSAGQIGGQIGTFETIKFTSLTDPNRQIIFRNGSTLIDLSNSTNAATFETNLKNAFGFGTGGAGLNFQIGQNSSDQLNVKIGNAKTVNLFGGATLDVTTQPNAVAAGTVLDTAINTLGEIIADVGSYQSSLEYTTNALNNSITYVDIARGLLADTDIASESTELAAATVQSQASIAVLAQVNSLRSTMLDLLRTN